MINYETDYYITGDDHILLMHRLSKENGQYSEFCVGEAFINATGYWEIRIAVVSDLVPAPGQIVVAISDSPVLAREVLWEQRHLMHWGVYQ